MEFITQHPVLVVSLVKIAVLLFVVMTALAYLTWFERKVVARIQSRWGPYYVGAHGLLQPLADGLKFLFKEDMTPPASDKFAYTLAPFLALSLALTAIALIPFGPPSVHGARPAGLRRLESGYRAALPFRDHVDRRLRRGPRGMVVQQQISAAGRPAQFGADDQLRSFAHAFGGGRAAASPARSTSTSIISGQSRLLPALHPALARDSRRSSASSATSLPPIAETNRIPFDLPEAETELVAGFHTEYSSFKFAMFFMAEYANMITVSCLATILFFGGWLSPFPDSWTWQLFLPGAGLVLLGIYCAWRHGRRTCAASRSCSLPWSRMLCLGGGAICLIAAWSRP